MDERGLNDEQEELAEVVDVPGEMPGEESGWREKALRVAAELENVLKRSRREMERARRDERVRVVSGFLEVLDNFDRAMGMKGAEGNEWLEGMDAIRSQMVDVLGRLGVRPFKAMDEVFDPEFHEAMAMAPIPGKEGLVVEVIQMGYVMDEEFIVRPAKVVVGKAEG